MEAERRHVAVRPDGQRECSRALVPVGALEDPRLPLEPETLCLLDVLATRGEDVEDEAPVGLEETVCRAERSQLLLLRLHVQERAERADDERDALGHRRLAQVAQAEVDAARDAGLVGGSARDGEHRGGGVDADDLDARAGDRDRDTARPDSELDHGASGRERLVHVEAHVLGDGPAPGVVERRDPVVERQATSSVRSAAQAS